MLFKVRRKRLSCTWNLASVRLRVDCARWGQTPEDLRHLALRAPHARSRERALALFDITQHRCATQVAMRTGRAGSHRDELGARLQRTRSRGRRLSPHRRPPSLFCPHREADLGQVVRSAQRAAATPPLTGGDPAPRWTLPRLVGWARERFGLVCGRETIRAALHRLKLSWKKAKTLLGRANPERRQAFIEQLQGVLDGAQRDRHLLVYLDEAHIHQDADLGYGWAERGQRLWVNSSSPGLSARISFYGLYLYNEGQVRLWPFPARQRRPHDRGTAPSTRRVPRCGGDRALGRRAVSPGQERPGGRDGPEYHADAAAGLQPGSEARGGPLALAAGGRHRSPLPCQRRRPDPAGGGFRGVPEPRALRHRRPPLGQRHPPPRRGETALLKIDVVEVLHDCVDVGALHLVDDLGHARARALLGVLDGSGQEIGLKRRLDRPRRVLADGAQPDDPPRHLVAQRGRQTAQGGGG